MVYKEIERLERRLHETEKTCEALRSKAERCQREVERLCQLNHQRNLELDALHYIWCAGGCEGGIHRFEAEEKRPLSRELLEAALDQVGRMIAYYLNARSRDHQPVEGRDRLCAILRAIAS